MSPELRGSPVLGIEALVHGVRAWETGSAHHRSAFCLRSVLTSGAPAGSRAGKGRRPGRTRGLNAERVNDKTSTVRRTPVPCLKKAKYFNSLATPSFGVVTMRKAFYIREDFDF